MDIFSREDYQISNLYAYVVTDIITKEMKYYINVLEGQVNLWDQILRLCESYKSLVK